MTVQIFALFIIYPAVLMVEPRALPLRHVPGSSFVRCLGFYYQVVDKVVFIYLFIYLQFWLIVQFYYKVVFKERRAQVGREEGG
jgi:hypothetical protein